VSESGDAMSQQWKYAGSVFETTASPHCSSMPRAMASIRLVCWRKFA